jgi:hypothetical protein
MGIGKYRYWDSFQELLMLKATTVASGICSNNLIKPLE